MKKALIFTALLGAFSIILGAFGAHILKGKLSPEALNGFETAVRYQMYHVLVLLFTNTYSKFSLREKKHLNFFFFSGVLCFSGSLYLLYLGGVPAKNIWFITPLGGLLLTIGWLYMLFSFFKKE